MSGMHRDLEKALPVYLVVDVSSSMAELVSPDGAVRKIDVVNQIVPELKVVLQENHVLADKVRFSLIDFADEANVVLPMMALQDLPSSDIPVLTTRGGTSYGAAFRRLKEQIESDRAMLRGDNLEVYRAAVFFVSDGEPTDGSAWKVPFEDLVESQWYPNLIPLGVPGAVPDVLQTLPFPTGRNDRYRNMVCYMASDGATPAAILSGGLSLLTGAVSGARAAAIGVDDVFQLPDPEDLPEGVDVLGWIDDDDHV